MTMKQNGPLPSLTGDAMLLGAALLWGVNVSVIALMLRHLGPVALSVSRMGTGTLLLVALTLTAEGSISVCRRDLPLLLGAGLLTLADQLAFTYALKDINAATVSLLFGATPLFVMVLSVGFGWIALSWRHWTAAGLGLAGVAIIVTYGQRVSFHHLVGALLVVGASLSAAGYTLLLKPLAAKYSGQKVLAYVFGVSAMGGAGAGIDQLLHQRWGSVPALTWVEFAASVAFSTLAANALYFFGLKRLGPVRATMYTNLVPVFGVLAAGILLSVRPSLIELGGGLMIIISLLVEPSRASAAEPT